MTKETFVIILKAALTVLGSWLMGKNLFGHPIDQSFIEIITGIAMAAFSIAWSIYDKSYSIESIQATVRQAVLLAGGFLISTGKITPERLDAVLGVLLALIPVLQSYLAKKKVAQIQQGKIAISEMAKIPATKKVVKTSHKKAA